MPVAVYLCELALMDIMSRFRPRNDLYSVEWDVKPLLNQSTSVSLDCSCIVSGCSLQASHALNGQDFSQ